MRKLLTIAIILYSYSSIAQEMTATDVKQIVDDKKFVFVATASSGGKPEGASFWQNVYAPAPSVLDKDASIGTFVNVVTYPNSSMHTVANKMTGTKTDKFAVVHLEEESASFHPSVFRPAYNQLIGLNPDSLNKSLTIQNYSIKTNKKGKIFVNFRVTVSKFDDQFVKLIVLPDGRAEMTIAGTAADKRYPQHYKGYIQDLASL